MSVEVISVKNNHLWVGNPLAEQHRLRYREVIQRQQWSVPHFEDMEFDQYDTPAALYIVKRHPQFGVVGVIRLCGTDRPYMLREKFSFLVDGKSPQSATVWEATRLCVDHRLPGYVRSDIKAELILSMLQLGLEKHKRSVVGFMPLLFWRTVFKQIGCPYAWLGNAHQIDQGLKVRAGIINIKSALSAMKEHAIEETLA